MNRLTFATLAAAAAAAICSYSAATPALAQQGGTIEGRVKVTAVPPANPLIRMGADPSCLKINQGKRVVQETVLRAADGSLANAFAYVKGSFQAGPPTTTVTIDQQGCTYHPRIQGARVGQTLEIKNSDATLHNIHSMSTKGQDLNVGQPMAGMVYKYQLKAEEVMLHVKCDVHSWMTGYIGVLTHPYYAVSDAAGTFKIAGVPAGRQTIEIWHEKYGPLTQTVDVKAGASMPVEFTYTGNEQYKPAASMQELVIPAGTTAIELVAAR